MEITYDIFREEPHGPVWVETSTGIQHATDRLQELHLINSASYFAYNAGEIVARFPDRCVNDQHKTASA
jgi:hypothetical protein